MKQETIVGYVGLGALGGAPARRLLSTHQLYVCDLNAEAVSSIAKLGAKPVSSTAELAYRCDVVFLCLPRSADVEQAVFGPEGLADQLSPGAVIIDQTSGIPSITQEIGTRLAARGIAMVDAPVSGSPQVVATGACTIMVSGSEVAYQRALPLLQAITANVIHCGARLGDAQAMKLVNNTMNAGCRLATLEVVAMGKKMGLSLEAMTNVINRGLGRSNTSKAMLPALLEGRRSTQFALSLMLKDLNQGIGLGMSCGAPMTIATVVRGLLQTGANILGASAQLEDVVGLIESMANARIKEPLEQKFMPCLDPIGLFGLRVGYVGLCTMGGFLARRMMLSREIHVFDTRAELVRTFVADGAISAADLPSIARTCDVILICVSTSAAVREVLFGPSGLAEGLRAGTIVVDQTIGDPTETRRLAAELAELKVSLVDAPTSGRPQNAETETVEIMCGGTQAAFARVRPILESVSPNIVYCGESGSGHVAMLVNNAVSACNWLITYETVSAGLKYGLSIEGMRQVINRSSGCNGASEQILPALATGSGTMQIELRTMVKDLKLAGLLAIDCGAPLFIANTVRGLFEVGENWLGASENIDRMGRLFEEMAAVNFASQASTNA